MKVLIFGAGNSISIFLARYLHCNAHSVILADTGRFERGFYSRYCSRKYILRKPHGDSEGFFSDLSRCIEKEDIDLIVPTSDQAMLDILSAKGVLPEKAKVPFPLDYKKISYVMDKRNIPSICETAGIYTVDAFIINNNMTVPDIEQLHITKLKAPYVLKISGGHSGAGFMKVATEEEVKAGLKHMKLAYPEENYLVQEYIEGEVYGAGAVFEENRLKHFYSYKYFRRYPALCGPPTVCQVDYNETVKEAMNKALIAIGWSGFCQMDFILDKRDCVPLLIDINPVHWYSVPNSLVNEFNSLSYYLDGGSRNEFKPSSSEGRYITTIWLFRELQRIVSGILLRGQNSPSEDYYWKYIRGLKCSDFYWDPLPIVLAPFLKLLRLCTR